MQSVYKNQVEIPENVLFLNKDQREGVVEEDDGDRNDFWDGYDSDQDPAYVNSETESDSDDETIRRIETKSIVKKGMLSRSLSGSEYVENNISAEEIDDLDNREPDEISENASSGETNAVLNAAEPTVNQQVPQVLKQYSRKLKKERTLKRHRGEEYVTAKGKVIRKRQKKDLGNCRLKCKEWLTEDVRNAIFEEYWTQGTHDKRVNFIAKCVTSAEVETRRKRKETSSKERNITYNYSFEINGQRRKCCKKCFQSTLDETDKFLQNALKNKSQSVTGIITADNRGRHIPANVTSEDRLKKVVEHINSFPKYESHYTRRVNDKQYLNTDLNLTKMYKLYLEITPNPVGRNIYEREFHKLNLKFKPPKTDRCHKCEVLKIEIDVTNDTEKKEQLKLSQAKHHNDADLAYRSKQLDKEKAKQDPSFACCTFDLQQCLPTPFVETSVSFYKRKYWTYNLTVHDCASGEASCFLWHESIALRGANEIASCLFKYLMNLPPEITDITLYSDTCSGQNKNCHVAAMFLTVMQLSTTLKQIDHKFMISGHSHMECDVDHSLIEKQKKKSGMKICHPQDWATLIRCTNKKRPFNVVELGTEDFYDFAALLRGPFLKKQKTIDGEVFKLQNCRWIRYTKKYGTIFFKNSLEDSESFKEINFARRGRPGVIELKKKYQGPVPIAEEKKKHLLELLPLLPEVYKNFYEELPTKNVSDNDPDLEDFVEDE